MNNFIFKLPYLQKYNKLSNASLGILGEQIAAKYYKKLGYTLIGRNIRYNFGEIDLIVKDQCCIIFVEVKTRRNRAFGSAYEQITGTKLKKMRKCLYSYLSNYSIPASMDIRVDIIGIDILGDTVKITHLKDIIY